jgi:hypothetical protein
VMAGRLAGGPTAVYSNPNPRWTRDRGISPGIAAVAPWKKGKEVRRRRQPALVVADGAGKDRRGRGGRSGSGASAGSKERVDAVGGGRVGRGGHVARGSRLGSGSTRLGSGLTRLGGWSSQA